MLRAKCGCHDVPQEVVERVRAMLSVRHQPPA
jgi:hypothetical protein